MNKKEFYKKLEKHDWTFQYSDCHKSWVQGLSERDEIKHLMHGNEEFKKLYSDYYDYVFSDKEKPKLEGE